MCVYLMCTMQCICVCVMCRVDPDSCLYADMQSMKDKEGFDHILFNFTFKVLHRQLSLCVLRTLWFRQTHSHSHSFHPLISPLSQRVLNPVKPLYDPDQPDGRLNITASAFNQLGQYTSSPGRRGYCYAELAVFFPSGGCNHRQYSLRPPTEGWPGWVGLGGWLRSEIVYLPEGCHPSQY